MIFKGQLVIIVSNENTSGKEKNNKLFHTRIYNYNFYYYYYIILFKLFCSHYTYLYRSLYLYIYILSIKFCYINTSSPGYVKFITKMEALQYSAKEKKLNYVKIPIPKIEKDDDVLIKVAYAGICGTDLHIIQGEFPCNQKVPFSLGHEFSGTVVKVGDKVKSFKEGDRVSVDPNR